MLQVQGGVVIYIGSRARNLADSLGLKLWVTKHDDKRVLNIYCRERDRMLVNYDMYGGGLIRGKRKIMSEEGFRKVPITIMSGNSLMRAIHAIHEINEKEKAQSGNV